jgi:hypothetical protein
VVVMQWPTTVELCISLDLLLLAFFLDAHLEVFLGDSHGS